MLEPRHVLTILAVKDVQRASTFYSRVLGWRQVVNVPVYSEFEGPAGMRFGVYERQGFGRNTGHLPIDVPEGALAPTEMYFWVDDLASAIKGAEAAGARLLSGLAPRDWGDEAAYFADPDGNVLVLARPLPR